MSTSLDSKVGDFSTHPDHRKLSLQRFANLLGQPSDRPNRRSIFFLFKQFSLHFAAISIILFGIWFLRFLMYAMIDYTAFPGDDLRYLFPTSVFLYALPFLLFALFLNEGLKSEEVAN